MCRQAYFERTTPHLSTTAPARTPFLSLLLTFLCRHPGKAYHVLSTPLLSALITFCLTSPSPAAVTLGIKSLSIFLTALPVIIGENALMGIFAVYGRVVCWEKQDLEDVDEAEGELSRDQGHERDRPPSPLGQTRSSQWMNRQMRLRPTHWLCSPSYTASIPPISPHSSKMPAHI